LFIFIWRSGDAAGAPKEIAMASNQQNTGQGSEQRAEADAPLSAPASRGPAGGAGQADAAAGSSEGSIGQGGDGRFEVAEEVSLDQQSDNARRVGQAPSDVPGAAGASATEAAAQTVQGEAADEDGKGKQADGLDKAAERAIPPPGSWT
jgi:hypothetical protein